MPGIKQTITGTAELALPESIASATMGGVDTNGFENVLANATVTTQLLGTIPESARAPAHVSILNSGSETWGIAFGKEPADVITQAAAPILLLAGEGIVIDAPRKGAILCIKEAVAAGEIRAEGAWAT